MSPESDSKPTKKTKRKTRGPKEKFKCSSCGFVINPKEHPPNKTWNMISPLPDKQGRVTLTIMGSFTCPRCSKNLKVSLQKIKSDDEFSGKSKKDELLEILKSVEGEKNLEEVAASIGLSLHAVTKATSLLIKKGEINGTIKDNLFIVE